MYTCKAQLLAGDIVLHKFNSVFEGAVATTFGEGDGPVGPIVLENLLCTGSETRLADCQRDDLPYYYCYHPAQVAGVVCQGKYTYAYTHMQKHIHAYMHPPTPHNMHNVRVLQ